MVYNGLEFYTCVYIQDYTSTLSGPPISRFLKPSSVVAQDLHLRDCDRSMGTTTFDSYYWDHVNHKP